MTLPSVRARRALFWCYAAALFIGTHWPALRVSVPGVERPDLVVHLAIFGLWMFLFWGAAYIRPVWSARSIAVCVLIACAYAAADELLQAIPALKRTAAWDDFAANTLGIAIVGVGLLVIGRIRSRLHEDAHGAD